MPSIFCPGAQTTHSHRVAPLTDGGRRERGKKKEERNQTALKMEGGGGKQSGPSRVVKEKKITLRDLTRHAVK